MRKLLVTLLTIPFFSNAQEARIQFDIINPDAFIVQVVNGDYTNPQVLFGESDIVVPQKVQLTNGKGNWSLKLSKPVYVTSYFQDSITNKYSNYTFYLTPGDDLVFSFDTHDPENTFTVKGKGKENNQPLIQNLITSRHSFETHKKDTLPGAVFAAIKEKNVLNKKLLEEYISAYNPSSDFVKLNTLYIQYFPLITYIQFKGNQKFNIREAFLRNEDKWQAIEDSLTTALPVSNSELLPITKYDYFLATYLTRIKERLWQHPELLKDYYGTTTQEEAVKINNEDPENLLKEKIINKHFSGKIAEFLYAQLFKEAINEKEDNLPEIFARFRQQYPGSPYIPYIQPAISRIEKQRKRTLSEKMVFVENPESYQTFDDLLKLVKGKTVLLDMWGTWCGPCLSEFTLNSDSLKERFKDSELEFVYIANYDTEKELKWKKLIAYYNLTGMHLLATSGFTKDIMASVKGSGYPTYVIIKKDGSFELSEAGYPMDRNILIKQLEKALME